MPLSSMPGGTRDIALVLGGGNALGAYLAGAYEELHDQRVRPPLARQPAHDDVARHRLVGRDGVEAVGAGQVQHRVFAAGRPTHAAFLALDGDPGVVGHFLPAAGQQVEQRGLAAVGVADQRDAQR